MFADLQRNAALSALLARILDRISIDLPDVLGSSIIARDVHGVHVLAQHGDVDALLIANQLRHDRGPVPDALTHQVPVISLNVLHDDRWPDLGTSILHDVPPTLEPVVSQIVGAAAVPAFAVSGSRGEDATVVLSVTLSRPASAATVTNLIGYEQLIDAAVLAATADIDDALAIVHSRGVIDQAKGMIMCRLGCDADHAFQILRETSQHTNVKLRDLAEALVVLVAAGATDQPSPPTDTDDGAARQAAHRLWTALTEIADPPPQSFP